MWARLPTLSTWCSVGIALHLCAGTLAAAQSEELAKKLLETADLDRGICAVLGIQEDLPIQLARSSNFLVHVRDPRAQAVTELRKRAAAAGLGIQRLAAGRGNLNKLPYADNTVDLVVTVRADAKTVAGLSVLEVLRVLRPGGMAIVGQGRGDADRIGIDKLKRWATSDFATGLKDWGDRYGTFVSFKKPIPRNVDDWSHWEKGPDKRPPRENCDRRWQDPLCRPR